MKRGTWGVIEGEKGRSTREAGRKMKEREVGVRVEKKESGEREHKREGERDYISCAQTQSKAQIGY